MAVAIPVKPEELEEILADDKKRLEIFSDPESTRGFLVNYVKATNKAGDVGKMVKDNMDAALADFMRENGMVKRPDLSGGGARNHGAAYNKRAIGTILDKEFEDLPHFLQTVAPGAISEHQDLWKRIRNDYSSVEPSAGGFLVPEVLRAELLKNSLETGIMRPRARVVTMDSASVPFPAIDETSHASTVYGGISGAWVEEGAALPESEAKFGRVVLKANKLVTYCEVPSELVSDSAIAFADFINTVMPEAIAFFEDVAFISGTGVGQPLGWLGAPVYASVTKETNQLAGTIVWENIVKVFARMLPASLGRAIWVASIDSFPQLATMALAVGTGGSAVWLNNGAVGPPMTILGRPVIFTEKTALLGTVGDLSFIDPGMYLIGDRQQMRVESSKDYKFGNDLIAYRVIERADGRPWMQSALTPKNSGSSLSPFVGVATRA